VYEYSCTGVVSQAIKSLVLYKRHLPTCAVHKSRVAHTKRRFWMACECPIWIHGRTPDGDIVPRQSTQFSDIKRAEALRASLMGQVQADSFSGPPVSECVKKNLATRETGPRFAYARASPAGARSAGTVSRGSDRHPHAGDDRWPFGDVQDRRTAEENADHNEGYHFREDTLLSTCGFSAGVDQRGSRRSSNHGEGRIQPQGPLY
jgi:hypothetical protein